MNISDSLYQYADICRNAIKNTSAKLNKSFEKLLIEILLFYMVIPRKINFTQMANVRHNSKCDGDLNKLKKLKIVLLSCSIKIQTHLCQ